MSTRRTIMSLMASSLLIVIVNGGVSAVEFVHDLGLQFANIPPGRYIMGSCTASIPGSCLPGQEPDPNARPNEMPSQTITFTSPFQMGVHPVTIGQFKAFMTANPEHQSPNFNSRNHLDDNYPVAVSWYDTQAFIAWLNRSRSATDRGLYRLPSEAEWEYAARSGTQTPYWWGREVGSGHAQCQGCGGSWSNSDPTPVGTFAANPFGLHDMLGTIWEWTDDCWKGDHADAPADGSAYRPSGNCSMYVLKGGMWYSTPASIRAAARLGMPPSHASANDGFRMVRVEEGPR